MKIGFFGPEGTFSHAAALRDAPGGAAAHELVAHPRIADVVAAVADRRIDRGVVPIENSLEGSVNATLDALAAHAAVRIIGESVLGISQCLVAGAEIEPGAVTDVVSHPHALAQCAEYLRVWLPEAELHAAASTATAVRTAIARGAGWAALGSRVAAEQYGGVVIAEGVEDETGNVTRFVWLAHAEDAGPRGDGTGGDVRTAVVFWGAGADAPGWLVGCLQEFSERGINLTRIESRPGRRGLGTYRFFVELEGHADSAAISGALAAIGQRVEVTRVLGEYTSG